MIFLVNTMSETCDKCGMILDTSEAMKKHMEESHKVDPADVHSVPEKAES